MQRWIMHMDMDAFYAAIEQRDRPELAGLPVIVGGLGPRGVVATASYEARPFGVHSAMPMEEARRRCPQGVYLAGDHARYRAVSRRIFQILEEFSPLVEPLALDEAFLDVSGMERLAPDLTAYARQLKQRIYAETALVASVGLAPNKFLAKLASDWQKPDGLVVVKLGCEKDWLGKMPVGKLWGVGRATLQALHKLGVCTIGDLARMDAAPLARCVGAAAPQLRLLAQGVDDRPVTAGRPPQSIGKETTFDEDVGDAAQLKSRLLALAEQVGWRLRRGDYWGRTVTVKIRFASFRTITRSRTLPGATQFDEDIYRTALALYESCKEREKIRLLGISVSHLSRSRGQTALFDDHCGKREALYEQVDALKARYGEKIITKAQLLGHEKGRDRLK